MRKRQEGTFVGRGRQVDAVVQHRLEEAPKPPLVGVLGVAFIQAALATIGLMFAGVPAVGIWAFLILLMAIAQLPPLLVLLPLAIWVFGSADSQTTAWILCCFNDSS